jgi:hypothetical protein
MALHPKRNNEDTSLRGIVGRAFGPRSSKQAEDPVAELDEVLTQLQISEQEHEPPYDIERIHIAEADPPNADAARQELEAHRRRLEQLLENARHIEEMLAKEAAKARALGENLRLEEKRAAAAEAAESERKAIAEGRAYTQNSETAVAYQAKVDGELTAARQEFTAAEASVKELRARLADAQNLVVLSKAKVLDAEVRSKEAAKRVDLAKALSRDVEIRIAKCREAREAAETEVSQAEQIASSIALTAQTLKRIRALGSSELQ